MKESAAVVVDQNVGDRRSIASILRKEFKITNIYQSGTARDALALLKDVDNIEWVLSESDLPDQTGFEFVTQARQLPSTQHSSFIMLSTRRDREALLLAAQAGVADYVIKPFTSSTLVSKLRKIANGHERRETKRIEVLADHKLHVTFGDHQYQGSLLDLSLGGCLVRTELFNKGGGCIYEVANLTLEVGSDPLSLKGKVVRTEGDLETNPDASTMKAAFRFINADPKTLDKISLLLASLKGKS